MLIRIRTILVIFSTTLVIVAFSVLVGILTVRTGIETSQETDLMLLSEVADSYISSEIKALRQKAEVAAQMLSSTQRAQWPDVFESLEDRYPDFIGLAVLDTDKQLSATKGRLPASAIALDDRHVQQAFHGRTTLSSTVRTSDGMVFYISAPIPGSDGEILAVTLPGTYFSQLLSSFSVWETGHIFLDDAQGRLIANPRPAWVEDAVDFMSVAEIDESYREIVVNLRQASESEARLIRYSIYNVPRICAYRLIGGSEEGWLLGVVAPLDESPFRYIDEGLIIVGAVSLLLSIIAAFIASGFIKRPFEQIAALKEEAEAISKYKSDFLTNMSHEIRTPMNAILGIAEILIRNETVSPQVSEGLSQIYNSGDMLLSIVNDILDLSKIEAGKLELFISKYEAASLINDTVTLNMMRIGSKEINFKLLVDENMPQTLYGDDIRIKQILNNLLSNAFKYTEKGEVKLSFSVFDDKGESNGSVTLIITVADTGQGMTEEQVSGIFEQFSRYNYEANRAIEGTGLGMNITQNLIKLMNGEINVESEPGRGSVFTVRLPQGRAVPGVLGKELAENLQEFRISEIRHTKKFNIVYEPMHYGSVLIVDDVESNLYVAKGLMLPYELSVETVLSGYDAIAKIKNGNVYDIVFMDHMMPKMDGIEATKIIRDFGYAHPIIALTANAVKGQQEMFLANGFDDFVSKPIDTRHLNSVLKKYIRDKQPPEVLDAARRHDSGRGSGENDYAGDAGAYPDVSPQLAEIFDRDANRAIDALDSMTEKGGGCNEDDLGKYTTIVHAMKSALANVGEHELSAFAGMLEQSGRDMESGVIAHETPMFLKRLRGIVDKLAPQDSRDNKNEATQADYMYLNQKLLAIKSACGAYDRKTAKDAIAELRQKKWAAPVNEHLVSMSEHLLSGGFDEISHVVDVLIETGTLSTEKEDGG